MEPTPTQPKDQEEETMGQSSLSSSLPDDPIHSSSTSSSNSSSRSSSKSFRFRSKLRDVYTLPRTAYRIYTSYFDKLWKDTDTSVRNQIADDKVRTAIRQVQHILQNTGDYNTFGSSISSSSSLSSSSPSRRLAKQELLQACEVMLQLLKEEQQQQQQQQEKEEAEEDTSTNSNRPTEPKLHSNTNHQSQNGDTATTTATTTTKQEEAEGENNENDTMLSKQVAVVVVGQQSSIPATTTTTTNTNNNNNNNHHTKKKKQQPQHRSILFGAVMGAAVACWVFSGNYVFTGLFCLMTILGQLEYYRMVMNTGVFPARRISVVGATSMFVTALFAPELHQICLPMFGLWAMTWKLTMRQQIATIPEIATTFTGMFYLGYVPSFWVRTRLIGADATPTRLYPFTLSFRTFLKEKFGFLLPPQIMIENPITTGSVFIFWSWLSLAFSDVGAYFVGRKYGKTKLGRISPAAGVTSPNKSVEGVLGGCIASAVLSILGAWVQKWPYFVVTGAIHGTILALLGLIGDLTASMLKRDAGLKDFGDLIPEHGGILDRVDSFVWTAPYSWLVCAYIIPALKTWAGQP
ncbi:phosphatidate cytidylyltransferase [Nitzschia inconspicua]|uniref:Phosphatidate cytidylyltransferase n=1 Tax=Nitzschia inconspicua TaxID=303405 RepID=A0A9K3LPD2_9STRA|nr:phosphatidate cytidylyltransferase [Nitzschia inconspicua]KAG7365640.1 phosphatidate cytidylyltransferase [Nitzschia inconspicua]